VNPNVFTEMQRFLRENPKMYESLSTWGTGAPAMMASMIPQGNLPIRNFKNGDFPVDKIDSGTLKKTIRIGWMGVTPV